MQLASIFVRAANHRIVLDAMRDHPDAKSHMQPCAELADSFDRVICTVRHTAS